MATPTSLLRHVRFPRADLLHSAPSRRALALRLVQVWLLILLRKYAGSSGVPCVLDVTTLYSLEATCAMRVVPMGATK